MDEKKFLNAYQSIKFRENTADCFSLAGNKRQILTLSYFGSLQLNERNNVTEFLLDEGLKEYAEIVDNKNPGSVNNYAECVLSLLGNYQNDDRKNWKSKLQDFNLREHLEPLPCSNSFNCRNSSSLRELGEELKSAFEQYEEDDVKNTGLLNLPNNGHTALEKRNVLQKFAYSPRKGQTTHNQNIQQEEENKTNETFYFRTARDELHVQNAKKFGKNANTNDKLNNGPVKKSLGTRKGGVFGKFQPPVRTNENKDDGQYKNTKMEVDEVDERLKNIDPNMIETIKNEIMDSGTKITWDDIAGLHLAKSTIQEIVVWPMLRPDIFTGLRRPPKGILLFGPPGTGKTLIGKCIASQSNSTFFSISASSLTSKWVGDGEKMVRTLFAVAKVYQPSVVFIDEIDSLLTQRSDSDHECSRRIKTEFLVQLDGAGTGDEDRILIIGATNRPQELDEAARRRLVKRLYIPLPDEEARKQIIENLISTERHCLTEDEIRNIAKLTDGYSGADVKNLCQEASLGPIRSISPSMIQCINPADVRPLNSKDFESALCRIKSSVSEKDLDIYLAWDKQYGCGSASA